MTHSAVPNEPTLAESLSRSPGRSAFTFRWLSFLARFSDFAGLCFVIGFSCRAMEAGATTYYVDPAAGNDANAGTSQSAPWQTIPGTRTTSDTDFLRSKWGSIVKYGPLVQPGDIIETKAGSSMTSAIGGRLRIDGNFFANGTSSNPIVIRVSSNWGAGTFIYNASGMSIPTYYPAVVIDNINYIQLRGGDATRRFSIVNASGGGWGIIASGLSGAKQVGVVLDYIELANNSYGGSSIYYSDNWTISNSIAHDNGSIGFDTGGLSDNNANNGVYSDDEAYHNGVSPTGGIANGFGLYGSTKITFLRCKSHDNIRDGFDFGTTSNTNSTSATVINSSSYNNGEDGFGANGGTAGMQTFNYINVISFNNAMSGWQIYDGAIVGIYHSVGHGNGTSPGFSGNILTYAGAGSTPPRITLRNNIFYKPKFHAQIGSYTSPGGNPIIDSNNNIYVPRSADTEVGFEFPYGTDISYVNPPSFIGAKDKLGIAQDPGFVSAVSTTDFLANNYHLSTGSISAFNAGMALSSITSDPTMLTIIAIDRDGMTRSATPDIGPYQYIAASSTVAAPAALRIVP